MKFVPMKKEDICLKEAYKNGANQELLLKFMESNADAAEVIEFTHSSAYVCTKTLNTTAKRLRIGCRVVTRRGRVFLIKTITKKIG